MSETSTMDISFSPEMGGKEALSALGYSRVRAEEPAGKESHAA